MQFNSLKINFDEERRAVSFTLTLDEMKYEFPITICADNDSHFLSHFELTCSGGELDMTKGYAQREQKNDNE